jgi:hypothetical protein
VVDLCRWCVTMFHRKADGAVKIMLKPWTLDRMRLCRQLVVSISELRFQPLVSVVGDRRHGDRGEWPMRCPSSTRRGPKAGVLAAHPDSM